MFLRHTRWSMASSWIALALLALIAADARQALSILLLAVVGLVLLVMIALWKERQPTIAEVLHATEERR